MPTTGPSTICSVAYSSALSAAVSVACSVACSGHLLWDNWLGLVTQQEKLSPIISQ